MSHSQSEAASQQVHAYNRFPQDGQTDTSRPLQGYILTMPQQHQALHSQHPAQPPHQAVYGQSHKSVPAVPQVLQHIHHQHAPVQYMNTFVREAVPGNSNAAHCSLQTDLCGAVWPLHQPFPIIMPALMQGSSPAYSFLTSAQGWGSSSGGLPVHVAHPEANVMPLQNGAMQGNAHCPPVSTLAESNLASHMSSQSRVPAMHVHGGMMPTPDHEVADAMGLLAAANATSSNQAQQPVPESAATEQQQQQPQKHAQPQQPVHHAASMLMDHPRAMYQQPTVKVELTQGNVHDNALQGWSKPPSPPSSPPPELLDLPFDFCKFEELEGVQAGNVYGNTTQSGQSAPADHANTEMDSMFDVPAISDSEDLFQIFTHDYHGHPMITSHIHQRHPAEDPSDQDLEYVTMHSGMGQGDFDGEGVGASVDRCRMATEADSNMRSSYISALGVASTS
jgi:hypothetical protein